MYEYLGLDHACLLMDHNCLQMELGIEDDGFWFMVCHSALLWTSWAPSSSHIACNVLNIIIIIIIIIFKILCLTITPKCEISVSSRIAVFGDIVPQISAGWFRARSDAARGARHGGKREKCAVGCSAEAVGMAPRQTSRNDAVRTPVDVRETAKLVLDNDNRTEQVYSGLRIECGMCLLAGRRLSSVTLLRTCARARPLNLISLPRSEIHVLVRSATCSHFHDRLRLRSRFPSLLHIRNTNPASSPVSTTPMPRPRISTSRNCELQWSAPPSESQRRYRTLYNAP